MDGVSGIRNIQQGWRVDPHKSQDDKNKQKQQSEDDHQKKEDDSPNSDSNHIDEYI